MSVPRIPKWCENAVLGIMVIFLAMWLQSLEGFSHPDISLLYWGSIALYWGIMLYNVGVQTARDVRA